MNQFEKYKLVWKIWTSFKKFELEINLNHNIYVSYMMYRYAQCCWMIHVQQFQLQLTFLKTVFLRVYLLNKACCNDVLLFIIRFNRW